MKQSVTEHDSTRRTAAPALRTRGGIVLRTLCLLIPWIVNPVSHACDKNAGEFVDEIVFGGHVFDGAAAVRFAPNGKVLVAERSGIIKIFDDVDDATPTIFADLRTNVYSFYDRGLLGLAVHPDFPNTPYVYVLYTQDAMLGDDPPLWGDTCPTPPGALIDGCVASSRLSRLRSNGEIMTGFERVLIEDWCQQYPSHSAGDLRFGPDGALYASHGEGANFQMADTGGFGGNPCSDPPKEGGSLRAQDLLTSGDPLGLHGTILRMDPITGDALPDNPLYGGAISEDDRIVAHGLRNPFRFTFRPGTSEIWIGDVGWNTWEEIDRLVDPIGAPVENFGWPCYEGVNRQPTFDDLEIPICEGLYLSGTTLPPYYQFANAPPSGHAISGVVFYDGGTFPSEYDGALFFSDYNPGFIHVMFAGSNGLPDTSHIEDFVTNAFSVDMQIGPDGSLYYVSFSRAGPATVHRVRFALYDQSPAALVNCLSGPNTIPTPIAPGTVASCLGAFDCDEDGDVDLRDFALYQDCVGGPGMGLAQLPEFLDCGFGPDELPAPTLPGLTPARCIQIFDLEGDDNDVDLRDFSVFMRLPEGGVLPR